ncbi:MAG TPA: flagellar hook-associated protein FlgK [Methylomirabilota bacterium]|nr:flagellar hook-associated protein FlgK [Methylomirabilota bacterium]
MSISSALSIALSGLKTNQLQLDSAANNVANSSTVGYSRRIMSTSQVVIGDTVAGVRAEAVGRQINLQVQRQWRTSVSGAEYAAVRAQTLTRLDTSFGGPDNPNSLDALFNTLTQSLERLAASPENPTTRIEAVNGAEQLALGIRTLSSDIQVLRQDAEDGIATAVSEANELLMRIADLDKQVVSTKVTGASVAGLEDERDMAVDRLAELMDVRVSERTNGAISINTSSGTLLYDNVPVQLRFDGRGTMQPTSLYSTDPAERGVGTIVIDSGPGKGIDLFADDTFRSGHIAALKELRDGSLVQAQAQVDELAARLSEALSTTAVAGTEIADGFAVDVTGIKEGNVISFAYEAGGATSKISFVATAGVFEGGDGYTPDPDDTVAPINFDQPDADVAAEIQAALGAGFTVAYAGGQLQITDASGGLNVPTALDARVTTYDLQGGPGLPLFLDAGSGKPFTGLVNGQDPRLGMSSRLILNPALKQDPAFLVKFAADTDASNDVRPRALLDSLSKTRLTFDPGVGVGTKTAPFTGTVEQYLKQVVSTQGAASSAAVSLAEGQGIVSANLELRYEESREVNIDEEMARLVELQTAYQANARVLSVAQEMLDALMAM